MTDIPTPVRAAAIFDFDGTLVPHIDHGIAPHPHIEAMKTEMQAIKAEGGIIIGNTGRSPELINGDKTGLAELPFDYICSSVGTVILQPVVEKDGKTTFQRMPEYDAYLSTPSDPNKIAYNKETVDAFLARQEGFSLQEPFKIGDSPRTGAYFTFTLENGLSEEEKNTAITAKIAEVKAKVAGMIDGHAWDAKHGVSKERENTDGTVILNVDVMSAKADKIGATKWLLNHIAEERKVQGTAPLNAAIIAGDSGNDKSNMDTAYYQEKGLQPAYVVPGNGHDDLVKHVQAERQNEVITFMGDKMPVQVTTSQDYFNHENYGLGGTLQGLQAVREQLREKLNTPATPTKITSAPQTHARVKERQAGFELPF